MSSPVTLPLKSTYLQNNNNSLLSHTLVHTPTHTHANLLSRSMSCEFSLLQPQYFSAPSASTSASAAAADYEANYLFPGHHHSHHFTPPHHPPTSACVWELGDVSLGDDHTSTGFISHTSSNVSTTDDLDVNYQYFTTSSSNSDSSSCASSLASSLNSSCGGGNSPRTLAQQPVDIIANAKHQAAMSKHMFRSIPLPPPLNLSRAHTLPIAVSLSGRSTQRERMFQQSSQQQQAQQSHSQQQQHQQQQGACLTDRSTSSTASTVSYNNSNNSTSNCATSASNNNSQSHGPPLPLHPHTSRLPATSSSPVSLPPTRVRSCSLPGSGEMDCFVQLDATWLSVLQQQQQIDMKDGYDQHNTLLSVLVSRADAGMKSGVDPTLADGALGGTYFLRDAQRSPCVVCKPGDEEPNGPWNPHSTPRPAGNGSSNASNNNNNNSSNANNAKWSSYKGRIIPGFGMYREVATYLLNGTFVGVPPTALARVRHRLFRSNSILRGKPIPTSTKSAAASTTTTTTATTNNVSPVTTTTSATNCSLMTTRSMDSNEAVGSYSSTPAAVLTCLGSGPNSGRSSIDSCAAKRGISLDSYEPNAASSASALLSTLALNSNCLASSSSCSASSSSSNSSDAGCACVEVVVVHAEDGLSEITSCGGSSPLAASSVSASASRSKTHHHHNRGGRHHHSSSLTSSAQSLLHSLEDVWEHTFSHKPCSVQAFVKNICSAEDMGPAKFLTEDVQRIAMLDIRMCNLDRHEGNYLVAYANPYSSLSSSDADGLGNGNKDKYRLIPIDHGYCLPHVLYMNGASLSWLYWPQTKLPVSQSLRDYIAAIDVNADIAKLKKYIGVAMSEPCLLTLRVCTLFLQRGVAAGLTLCDLGEAMTEPIDDNNDASELMDLEVDYRHCEVMSASRLLKAVVTSVQTTYAYYVAAHHASLSVSMLPPSSSFSNLSSASSGASSEGANNNHSPPSMMSLLSRSPPRSPAIIAASVAGGGLSTSLSAGSTPHSPRRQASGVGGVLAAPAPIPATPTTATNSSYLSSVMSRMGIQRCNSSIGAITTPAAASAAGAGPSGATDLAASSGTGPSSTPATTTIAAIAAAIPPLTPPAPTPPTVPALLLPSSLTNGSGSNGSGSNGTARGDWNGTNTYGVSLEVKLSAAITFQNGLVLMRELEAAIDALVADILRSK